MFPYLASTTIDIGPIHLQTWGTLVACGFLVATWIAAQRAKERGLEPKLIWDMAFWILVAAFLGARAFHVLFYEPQYYFLHPLEAFDPRKPGFAIEGGIVASAAVFYWFVKRHALDFLAYADTLVWGLPWGCGIGRIGCFLIHDHPGTLSHSIMAVRYPNGVSRQDLGLDLSAVGFVIGFIFLSFNKFKFSKKPGFFLGAFLILDSVARLWLDFYRIVDVRYGGLTPTQWLSFPMIALGVWILVRDPQKKVV